MEKSYCKHIFGLSPQLLTMLAVFLPAGVGFVLFNPHWDYKRTKTTKTRT
jgi:hypothetical protein